MGAIEENESSERFVGDPVHAITNAVKGAGLGGAARKLRESGPGGKRTEVGGWNEAWGHVWSL